MGIIIDLIIVAIFALFIMMGCKKGLTGSLIKLLSFAIALILAFILYKPVASIVTNNTQIDENIEQAIVSTFNGKTENEQEPQDNKDEESGINKTILDNINKEIENATSEAKDQIVDNTAKSLTTTIINVGSGICVFIVARFILFIIGIFANQITNLPILKQIDKLGGIAYGAVEALVIIYLILAIISFTAVINPDNGIVSAILKSSIGSMLYNNNLILKFLFK